MERLGPCHGQAFRAKIKKDKKITNPYTLVVNRKEHVAPDRVLKAGHIFTVNNKYFQIA